MPTTISASAVATRSQIDTRPATSASPSHNAATAHVSVMLEPPTVVLLLVRTRRSGGERRLRPALPASHVGIISLAAVFSGEECHLPEAESTRCGDAQESAKNLGRLPV